MRLNSLLAPCTLLEVPDGVAAGVVRRFAQSAAAELDFDERRCDEAAIVATELATNLARHAGRGMIVARTSRDAESATLDLLALDRGPGMRDVERCLEDGYSTLPGGSGSGLGAIRRLADEFDIHSIVGTGSAVLARFRRGPRPTGVLEIGAICLPFPGEKACGDAWTFEQGLDRCSLTVVDGLGHGPDAAIAANEAVKAVSAPPAAGVEELLERAHGLLKPTRGAAMAVADIHPRSRQIRFAGVGNIVGATVSAATFKRMVSHDGTIGHEVARIRSFDYALEPGQVIVMHSDGLRSQWRLEAYPGLLSHDPFLIAGVLYRDHFKGRDDATVVVGRVAA